LGLKLQALNANQIREKKSRYRGGLTVTAVRQGSPAGEQGIRRGDILVGMHIWETVSLENVAYVLKQEQLTRDGPIKFYILRGNQTLYGHMRIATQTRPQTQRQ
jgi:serine protease Do